MFTQFEPYQNFAYYKPSGDGAVKQRPDPLKVTNVNLDKQLINIENKIDMLEDIVVAQKEK